MRDAFGGLVNIVIIVVFLVIVTGYLAFNVNYTKAFRVKNKAITTIEQYEGNCESATSPCRTIIKEYADSLGYTGVDIKNACKNTKDCCQQGVCIDKVEAAVATKDTPAKYYYIVTTATAIDLPMVKDIMSDFQLFQVSGSTKTFSK